ncbi:MAG TPA: hypothetical protein VKB09_11900 [Thermomicrobiales bacterium]|nr:hypothetical protein [Thermomicrobiales bacterium]
MVRRDKKCRRKLLAPEELADLLPELGVFAADLLETVGEDDVAAGDRFGHELGGEEIGEVDRTEVAELLPVVGVEAADVLG